MYRLPIVLFTVPVFIQSAWDWAALILIALTLMPVSYTHLDVYKRQEWGNVILKNQSNDNDDSYLSFGLMNSGPELNFLYIEKERNAQIVSNQSVSTYGKLYRYPTLKTRESGYQFMPRLAKQVGQRRLIVPVVKRGNLGFAKLDF